jgi:hypothetical protein
MPSIFAQEGRAAYRMTVSEYQFAGDDIARFFYLE